MESIILLYHRSTSSHQEKLIFRSTQTLTKKLGMLTESASRSYVISTLTAVLFLPFGKCFKLWIDIKITCFQVKIKPWVIMSFLQWSASTAMAVLSTLPTFTRLFTKVGCSIILSLSFNWEPMQSWSYLSPWSGTTRWYFPESVQSLLEHFLLQVQQCRLYWPTSMTNVHEKWERYGRFVH